MNDYNDIMNKTRPAPIRPPMTLENRANIFAPFAALRGFDIEILTREQDRELEPRVALSSDMQELIEWELETLTPGDAVTVERFLPQKQIDDQELGKFTTMRGRVVKVSSEDMQLILDSGVVPFQNIRDIYRE